jgi:hypothetical protein
VSSDSTATTPVDVVVGQGTDPNAKGSLVNINTPIDANGNLAGTTTGSGLTTLPTVNVGQGSLSALGSTSGTGSLLNVNTPVGASTGSAATPAGTSALPLVNLG